MFRDSLTGTFVTLRGKTLAVNKVPASESESLETRKLSRADYRDSITNWTRQLLKDLKSLRLQHRQREREQREHWFPFANDRAGEELDAETAARPYPTPEPAKQQSRRKQRSEKQGRARWFSCQNEQQYKI